jgi:hypothetical protein
LKLAMTFAPGDERYTMAHQALLEGKDLP